MDATGGHNYGCQNQLSLLRTRFTAADYSRLEITFWGRDRKVKNICTYTYIAFVSRHLDDIKKYVPEFIPEFIPEFGLNTDLYCGTNSGMNSGTNFFYVI